MVKNICISYCLAITIIFSQACNDSSSDTSKTDSTSVKVEGTDHSEHSNAGHNEMMGKMHEHMNAIKMSGDFDLDFAKMMIPHHQGAVQMAEKYLPNAKDETIKALAQNIITSQKKEIEELNTMIANHKPSSNKDHNHSAHGGDGHNELTDAMKSMMEEMKAIKISGDADKDFVQMMIPHHESAINMAENQISHGKNLELKQFAQKVINDQTSEIKQLKDWLSKK